MRKQVFVLAVLAAVVIAVASAFAPSAPPPGPWKNLKVLPQDISKDSLDHIMHFYNASLGVKCNFCHARGDDNKLDFASDARSEKDVARYMMKLTTEINKNYFNFNNSTNPDTLNVVTCYTCHHGEPHAKGIPPADSTHQNNPPPPGTPGAPPTPLADSTKHR